MDKVEVYADASGAWRWRKLAPNNRIVADSGESYGEGAEGKRDALAAAEREARAAESSVSVAETSEPDS